MFTGIVTQIGTIRTAEQRGDLRVVIDADGVEDAAMGASISCSGVCLTVVDKGPNWFAVDVSGETVSKTAQGQWTVGRRLNLERALKLGEELGGHIVTGHIDGIGEVANVTADGDSQRITIAVPRELAPFIAPKGSVTVDGVSLTVNLVEDRDDRTQFTINLIPHTQSVTTLGRIEPGQAVNLEIDVLARYLSRMEAYRARH